MILYHGSNTPDLQKLEPRLADHDHPYVYLSTIPIVAAFYMINAAERPAYWFPYGFEKNGTPHYQEWYPHALRDAAQGKRGVLYTVEVQEETLLPLPGIFCARLSAQALPVRSCTVIDDCYAWLLEQERAGAFVQKRYGDKTPAQLNALHDTLRREIVDKRLTHIPEDAYARFLQRRFPDVWADCANQGQ